MAPASSRSVVIQRLLLPAVLCATVPALAAQDSASTSAVFQRHADRVVKVEVLEQGAAARASLGSGFFVSAEGLIVTNYHVVAQRVRAPDRYMLRVLDAGGDTLAATLLAVDVVHDLALLRADRRPAGWFALEPVDPRQGDRLLSLGHPKDLGLSVVEGTYNGLLRHTLYPKIHFSGSLNPGVSGGPAITLDGRVAGVNVSTEGEQVSFLVPVDRVIALVARGGAPGVTPEADLLPVVASQIRAYQDDYLTDLFAPGVPTVQLGRYIVPTSPAPIFRCWADADRSPEQPWELVRHQCSTDDYLYLSDGQWTGVVSMTHEVYSSDELNPLRFHALYRGAFSEHYGSWGDREEVTSYRCVTRNVGRTEGPLRAVICLRRFRKLEGLYDLVVRAAALGTPREGLVTTLELSGVSYDNATRVARRFLEAIRWQD